MLTRLLAATCLATAVCRAVAGEGASALQPLPVETRQFLTSYCVKCHGGEKTEEKLDLAKMQMKPNLALEPKRWLKNIARVSAGEIPPEESKAPRTLEREKFVVAVLESLQSAICASGPHPGPAPTRRLNRTEYGATLRDLLGIQATVGQLLPD